MLPQPGQIVTYRVRMGMEVEDANRLAEILPRVPADVREQMHDQLWLVGVFTEQRKRTNRDERERFDERANKILAALDPKEDE